MLFRSKEIINIPDLGSGMPFKSHAGIRFTHAGTIIYDLNQGLAGLLNDQTDLIGPRIDGIFQQFLHGTGGPLYDFPGRYLVSYIIGQ